MNPVDPCIPLQYLPPNSKARVIGENQEGYIPLPVIFAQPGMVISRWRFSEEERNKISKGEDLYLTVLFPTGSISPVMLDVGLRDWNKVF